MCRIQNLDTPGEGRGEAGWGGAGLGEAGQDGGGAQRRAQGTTSRFRFPE